MNLTLNVMEFMKLSRNAPGSVYSPQLDQL